jgi:hypothetical protein
MRVRLIPERVPDAYTFTDPDGTLLYSDPYGNYIRMDQEVRCRTLPGQPDRMSRVIRIPDGAFFLLWDPETRTHQTHA